MRSKPTRVLTAVEAAAGTRQRDMHLLAWSGERVLCQSAPQRTSRARDGRMEARPGPHLPMLILPLHRPLNVKTFPFVTALLMLANVFVFFGLQARDGAAMRRADEIHRASGLAALEVPAYARHLREVGRNEELAELEALPEAQRGTWVAARTLTDVAFVARLERGELFERGADF